MLKQGSRLKIKDSFGNTALSKAIRKGLVSIVALLLEARKNDEIWLQKSNDMLPIEEAVSSLDESIQEKNDIWKEDPQKAKDENEKLLKRRKEIVDLLMQYNYPEEEQTFFITMFDDGYRLPKKYADKLSKFVREQFLEKWDKFENSLSEDPKEK